MLDSIWRRMRPQTSSSQLAFAVRLLFLAMPVSWKGTLVQYTGRLHRLHPGKREVQLYDYVDREVPMLLRMFAKRLRGYRAIGYARGEAPLGFGEPRDELVVEYVYDNTHPTDASIFFAPVVAAAVKVLNVCEFVQ